MQSMTASDVTGIASTLSGFHGEVSSADLVNFGRTVLIRPGAMTSEGALITGTEVERRLGPEYQVFPIALEYMPSGEEAIWAFGAEENEAEVDELDAEVEKLAGCDECGDEFGVTARRSARLKARYLKVYGKLVKCRDLLAAGKGLRGAMTLVAVWRLFEKKDKRLARRAKKCARLQKRLNKVYEKMKKKGIDVSSLPNPMALLVTPVRTAVVQPTYVQPTYVQPTYVVPDEEPVQQVVYQQPQRGYVPTSRAVSPYYKADQAALERELEENMPSFGAWELAADLRAVTRGFQLSGLEHDYYGLAGTDTELVYADEAEDEAEEAAFGRAPRGRGLRRHRLPPPVPPVVPLLPVPPVLVPVPAALPSAPGLPLWLLALLNPFAALRRHGDGVWANRRREALLRRRRGSPAGADDLAALAGIDAALAAASPNGGVDFGRLRPRRPWSRGPLVIGIAIRKRPTDDLGAILRYDSRSAAKALRDATALSDWTAGSRAAFPQGDEAPLPPPRRVGEEVHGG